MTVDTGTIDSYAEAAGQYADGTSAAFNKDSKRAELGVIKSNGVPLCGPASKLKVRMANEQEKGVYRDTERQFQASDDLMLAYLVELDGLGPSDE